jgi:hypothetical protein
MTLPPTTPEPQPSVSPSLALAAATPPQPQPQPVVSVSASSSFAEVVSFMREEREQAKAERAEMEAKMDAKLEQAEEQKQAMAARVEHLLIEQQLPALQSRCEAMHAAKLLSDDELFSIEDVIADLEVGSDDRRAGQLITLSSRMAGDAAFSRQIRRKIL